MLGAEARRRYLHSCSHLCAKTIRVDPGLQEVPTFERRCHEKASLGVPIAYPFCGVRRAHACLGVRNSFLGGNMSAGFLVISIVAALLVVLPTFLVFRTAWRAGGVARIAALMGIATLSILALALLIPSKSAYSLEEGAVVFLATWGVLLALVSSSALLAAVVKGLWSAIRRASKPEQMSE